MNEVGTRELKDHLSQYIRKLQKGQSYTVTNHGEPVAQLIPYAQDVLDSDLQQLLSQGQARWGGGKPEGSAIELEGGEPVSDYVIEDRR